MIEIGNSDAYYLKEFSGRPVDSIGCPIDYLCWTSSRNSTRHPLDQMNWANVILCRYICICRYLLVKQVFSVFTDSGGNANCFRISKEIQFAKIQFTKSCMYLFGIYLILHCNAIQS